MDLQDNHAVPRPGHPAQRPQVQHEALRRDVNPTSHAMWQVRSFPARILNPIDPKPYKPYNPYKPYKPCKPYKPYKPS